MRNHRSRRTLGSVFLASALVTFLLVAPIGVLAASFVVTSIPGSGWIQSPDNTAGDLCGHRRRPGRGPGHRQRRAHQRCYDRLRRDLPSPRRDPRRAHGRQLDDVRHRRHRKRVIGAPHRSGSPGTGSAASRSSRRIVRGAIVGERGERRRTSGKRRRSMTRATSGRRTRLASFCTDRVAMHPRRIQGAIPSCEYRSVLQLAIGTDVPAGHDVG